jgi:hypothetical protein
VKFVTSRSTASDGINLSAQYAVNHNVAPIISLSYGLCEAALGPGGNAFWNSLWAQAAAQGILVFVSSGDGGAAGCDSPAPPPRAKPSTDSAPAPIAPASAEPSSTTLTTPANIGPAATAGADPRRSATFRNRPGTKAVEAAACGPAAAEPARCTASRRGSPPPEFLPPTQATCPMSPCTAPFRTRT